VINSIEINDYDKEYITIKSKKFADMIETICNKLGSTSPVQADGSFRAVINSKTKIDFFSNKEYRTKEKLEGFSACIVLTTPSIYTYSKEKNGKKTMQVSTQVHVKLLKIYKHLGNEADELKVDMSKLAIAE
jgi:predicted ATPase